MRRLSNDKNIELDWVHIVIWGNVFQVKTPFWDKILTNFVKDCLSKKFRTSINKRHGGDMRQLNSDGIIIFIEGFPKNQFIHWIVRLLIMQDKIYIVKLSLSLSTITLRESWHYNHSVPHHHHQKLFKYLRVDLYSSVIHH